MDDRKWIVFSEDDAKGLSHARKTHVSISNNQYIIILKT